jgi:hypothetical protein
MANGMALALGIVGSAVVESELVQVRSTPETPPEPPLLQTRRAGIEPTAFAFATGFVQVTQAAGSGNALANNLAVSLSGNAR